MKENKFFLNTALAVVMALLLLAVIVLRAFAPEIIIPQVTVPDLVLLSLIALVADHYIAPKAKRCWVCVAALSVVTFGVLPLAAGYVTAWEAVKLAVLGGGVFLITAVLYTSIRERLSSGPKSPLAPILSALGLYLASQAFLGMGL